MEALVKEKGTVALRKVDIVSWDSPVVKQHGVGAVPLPWLYDGQERVATNVDTVMRMIESAPVAGGS